MAKALAKKKCIPCAALIIPILFLPSALASDLSVGGLWTKTTHPDSQNIAIFYVDGQTVKAIGYGQISGKPTIWYAEGKFQQGQLMLTYRYSPDASPEGWEPAGTMQLTVSEDGTSMSGSAISLSGSWTGRVEFRRIALKPVQAS